MLDQFHHRRRRRLLAAALLTTTLTVAGCAGSSSGTRSTTPSPGHGASSSSTSTSASSAFPVTIHAGSGNVTIAAQPKAIVSLSPTATEMLYAIGAGSQVKAVDVDSDYPADAPHSKLNALKLNIEALAGYRPDLVVSSGISPQQASQLRALHIPVLDEPAATGLSDTYRQLAELGTATGHAGQAKAEVAGIKKRIAAIVARAPKTPSTYYWELDQTYYSETSKTFIGQLLALLGLHSIADKAKGAAASGGYPQLSAEYIVGADPDYVLLADTKCCHQSATTVAARPGWRAMGAVSGDRVVPLDDDIASRWGPRVVDLLQVVAKAIEQHPVPRK